MEFSRQEYWSGLPFPSPGDLPDPGIEPGSPALQVDYLPAELPGKPHFRKGLFPMNPLFPAPPTFLLFPKQPSLGELFQKFVLPADTVTGRLPW